MNKSLKIGGFELLKVQTGSHEFRIATFRNEKFEFQFNLSLQLNDDENILPSYQLTDKPKPKPIPKCLDLKIISDWIKQTEETKFTRERKYQYGVNRFGNGMI